MGEKGHLAERPSGRISKKAKTAWPGGESAVSLQRMQGRVDLRALLLPPKLRVSSHVEVEVLGGSMHTCVCVYIYIYIYTYVYM